MMELYLLSLSSQKEREHEICNKKYFSNMYKKYTHENVIPVKTGIWIPDKYGNDNDWLI
jgi:hypothetical protein